MDKTSTIEQYLFAFFSARFENLDFFFRTTHRDRQYGIYKLKEGHKLMDFLISIHSNVEETFYFKKLIPQKFTTIDTLLKALEAFKTYLESNQKYIDLNLDNGESDYIISEILHIKTEIIEAIEYCNVLYDNEDTRVPYQELRYSLITNNIENFISILKSILASVSYAITKTQEGFYHSNVHLILKLLGFDIISEELTNTGRIDAVIRLSDKIYILEFKFDKIKDVSNEALGQIKEKEYALKFVFEKKKIIGVGVSFSNQSRNINGYIVEQLH